jgi:hypothetical protein
VRIYLSVVQPKALKSTTKGIGSLIIGMVQQMAWMSLEVLACIVALLPDFICIMKSYGGLLLPSACERISATQLYLDGGFLAKTLTMLFAILS